MRRFKGVYALSFVGLLLLMGGYLFRLGDGPFPFLRPTFA